MDTDLYSLPKDMLVKLVATIREDTVREMKDKYEKVELFVNKAFDDKNVSMFTCQKCKSYSMATFNVTSIISNLSFSPSEGKWVDHAFAFCNYTGSYCPYVDSGPYCNECADHYLTSVIIDDKTVWCCNHHLREHNQG